MARKKNYTRKRSTPPAHCFLKGNVTRGGLGGQTLLGNFRVLLIIRIPSKNFCVSSPFICRRRFVRLTHLLSGGFDINHKILIKTGKSGVSPIAALDPNATLWERNWRKILEEYQRAKFCGFTTAELCLMEAMAPLDESKMVDSLSNPIHLAFARGKWITEAEMSRHRGPIPLYGDYDGFWLPEHLIVWNLLLPCLRLGSLVLQNATLYPWWDALFNGTYKDVQWQNPDGPTTVGTKVFTKDYLGEQVFHSISSNDDNWNLDPSTFNPSNFMPPGSERPRQRGLQIRTRAEREKLLSRWALDRQSTWLRIRDAVMSHPNFRNKSKAAKLVVGDPMDIDQDEDNLSNISMN
ncbi:hypothetical protein G7Y89_g15315 [Cudoniella acicularis]|uniref:Uncharacterized protein n=1 Tax=Cudoniella acicularis TaxID=354080 RepID=A0A8H4QRH2_9HELO|nr:hypothetical protein G7Y89_g15315 [Cudoniella acicularis]